MNPTYAAAQPKAATSNGGGTDLEARNPTAIAAVRVQVAFSAAWKRSLRASTALQDRTSAATMSANTRTAARRAPASCISSAHWATNASSATVATERPMKMRDTGVR